MKKVERQKILLALLLVLVVATLLLYPRTQRLNQHTFVDETFYLKHSAQFYWAVANHEYADTYLIVHPGVTTMWLGSAAFWKILPEYQTWESSHIPDLRFRRFIEDHDQTLLSMQVYTRAAVAAFNSLCLVGIFLLGWRLFGRWQAAGAVLLAGFSPYFFDYSRFLHIDGTLSILMLAALLAFMVYLKEGGAGWLALTAAAVGLSALTKVTGLAVLGVIGLLALLEWWRPTYNRFDKTHSWAGFKKLVGIMLILVFLAALTIFALWPALWAAPGEALGNILSFTLERSDASILSPMFLNDEIIETGVFDLPYYYFYPLNYLWRSTPISLLGLTALLLLFIFRKKIELKHIPWSNIGKILLYVLVYLVLITLSNQKFDRYMLPASLALDILAGLGWWYAAEWLTGEFQNAQSWVPSTLPALVLGAAVLAQAGMLYQVFPYGISYYNPLMGGPQKAPQVLQVGAGEGLDLAADYLMTVPGKKNLLIYSGYAEVFGYHFDRKVQSLPLYDYNGFEQAFDADYVILYLNQVQRGMAGPIVEFLADKPVEYTAVINGIEYAWVYHMSELIDDSN